MATLKFIASDSATAMEEVIRKLGPEALIVSTSKRGNKVEIEATNDKVIPKRNLSKTSKDSDFSEVLHSKIDFLREKQRNRIFSKNSKEIGGSIKTDFPDDSHSANNISDVKDQITALQNMLAGMVITDERGVNEKIGHSTSLKLRQLEFSPEVVTSLQPSFEGLSFDRGKAAFINAFSKRIAYEEAGEVLGSQFIFLVGPSGAGKTTMAAKLGARILEKSKLNDLALISTDDMLHYQADDLNYFSKILNVTKFKIKTGNSLTNIDEIPYGQKIIDVSSVEAHAKHLISEVRNEIGATKVTTVLCLPGSSNKQLIKNQLAAYKDLNPLIAFTKLDESEIFPRELSLIAEQNIKIGFITGSRSILGSLALANPEVISKYISNYCL